MAGGRGSPGKSALNRPKSGEADSSNGGDADDTLDLFYKPHTITLLIACITGLTVIAFYR